MTEPKTRDENRRKWHVDKSINLSSLVSIVFLAVAIVTSVTKLDTRITILEAQAASSAATQRERDGKQDESIAAVREDLKEINRKLDRLIERAYTRKDKE